MLRRLLLGPRKLRWFHHLGLLLAWALFIFGFGGYSHANLGFLLLTYGGSVAIHATLNHCFNLLEKKKR